MNVLEFMGIIQLQFCILNTIYAYVTVIVCIYYYILLVFVYVMQYIPLSLSACVGQASAFAKVSREPTKATGTRTRICIILPVRDFVITYVIIFKIPRAPVCARFGKPSGRTAFIYTRTHNTLKLEKQKINPLRRRRDVRCRDAVISCRFRESECTSPCFGSVVLLMVSFAGGMAGVFCLSICIRVLRDFVCTYLMRQMCNTHSYHLKCIKIKKRARVKSPLERS